MRITATLFCLLLSSTIFAKGTTFQCVSYIKDDYSSVLVNIDKNIGSARTEELTFVIEKNSMKDTLELKVYEGEELAVAAWASADSKQIGMASLDAEVICKIK